MNNKLLRILVITALVLFVGVPLLIEAILWLAFPVSGRVSRTVELNNQIPGMTQKVTLAIDDRGMRHWPDTVPAGGKPLNVVCFGGAATNARLQNSGDAWWGQLGALLQKEIPGSSVRISVPMLENSGILFGSRWAQEMLAEQPVDLVIICYGFDDITIHPGDYKYNPAKAATLNVDPAKKSGLKGTVLKASQIARRLSQSRQRGGLRPQLAQLRTENYFFDNLRQEIAQYNRLPMKYEIPRPEGQDPMVEYAEGVKAFTQWAKGKGAQLLVLGEPALQSGLIGTEEESRLHRWFFTRSDVPPAELGKYAFRLDPGWVDRELRRYSEAAKTMTTTAGVPYLNLHGMLSSKVNFFLDDTSLTDAGAAEFARLVLPSVKPLAQKKS